jgi:regulator of protease activity HflC (stomatin/prohibitin superfamily)
MLGWVSDLFETFGNLFPRLLHVQQTHRGVKFAGAKAKELAPGLHWWWPLTTEVVEIPVARQTVNLPIQGLVTSDGKQVAISGVVVYSIRSAMDAIVKNYDHEETLGDVAMTAIAEVVLGNTYEQLMSHVRDGTLEKELSKRARSRLKRFGFQVDRCALTDITPCRSIRLFQGE